MRRGKAASAQPAEEDRTVTSRSKRGQTRRRTSPRGGLLMHSYTVPPSVKARVMSRMGRQLANDTIEAGRTALVVVDMQNYFCGQGFPLRGPPVARDRAEYQSSGPCDARSRWCAVVWVRTTGAGAVEGLAQFSDSNAVANPAGRAPRRAQRGIGRLQAVSDPRSAGRRHARQEDQVQRLHAWLFGYRRAAERSPH